MFRFKWKKKINAWKGQRALRLDGHEALVIAELRLWAWKDH